LENGYKDAAAVIAGSTLEAHLKKLCTKHSLSTTYQNNKAEVKEQAAETMNEDLARAGIYLPTQKKVNTANLAIRNSILYS